MKDNDVSANIPEERIEIALNAEIKGKIEVLVEEGFYSDHSDFIEKAIESQMRIHKATFDKYKKKRDFIIGVGWYTSKMLEKIAVSGKKLDLKVIGVLGFEPDISPELIEQTIEKITVAGSLRGSDPVLEKLNSKRFTLLGKSYSKFKNTPELPEGKEE